MPRVYRHAVTGREVTVADGSRMAELVANDANYSEVDAEKPAKKAAKKSTAKKNKK